MFTPIFTGGNILRHIKYAIATQQGPQAVTDSVLELALLQETIGVAVTGGVNNVTDSILTTHAQSISALFQVAAVESIQTSHTQDGATPPPAPTPAPAGTIATLTLYPSQTVAAPGLPYMAAVYPLKGQVPTGNSIISDDDPTMQGCVINRWPDNSARTVIVCGNVAVTNGTPKPLNLKAGAPSGTNLTAATAIVGKLTNVTVDIPGVASNVSITNFTTPSKTWWASPTLVCCRYILNLTTRMQAVVDAIGLMGGSGGRVFVTVKVENGLIDAAASGTTLTAPPQQSYSGATVKVNGTILETVDTNTFFVGGGTVAAHWPWMTWLASGWVGGAPGTNSGRGHLLVAQDATSLQKHPALFKMDQPATGIDWPNFVPDASSSPWQGNMGFDGVLQKYSLDKYKPGSRGRYRDNDPGSGGEHPTLAEVNKWDGDYIRTGDPTLANTAIENALCYLSYRIHSRSSSSGNAGNIPTFAEIGTKTGQNNAGTAGYWPGDYMPRSDTRPYGNDGGPHVPETGEFLAFSLLPIPAFIEIAQSKCVQTYTANNFYSGWLMYSLSIRGLAWGIRDGMHALMMTPDSGADLTWRTSLISHVQDIIVRFIGPGYTGYQGGHIEAYKGGTGNALEWHFDYSPLGADDFDKGNAAGTQFCLWQPAWFGMVAHHFDKCEFLSGQMATDWTTVADYACQWAANRVVWGHSGTWRYVGNHQTYGTVDNPPGGTSTAQLETWGRIEGWFHPTVNPPGQAGPWVDNGLYTVYTITGNSSTGGVAMEAPFDVSKDSYYHKTFWAIVMTACERGVPYADDAYNTVMSSINNIDTWRAAAFSGPSGKLDSRWNVAPRRKWTPPYPLPARGHAVKMPSTGRYKADLCLTSSLISAGYSGGVGGNWATIFDNFGGGQMIRGGGGFGADAWAIAGPGGHHGTNVFGCLYFDFGDGQYYYVPNGNNVVEVPTASTNSQMTSDGEWIAATGNMPAPGHHYSYPSPWGLSPGKAGAGAKGAFLLPHTAFQDTNTNVSSQYAYKCDLASGVWSRVTSNRLADIYSGKQIASDGGSLYDPVTDRYYIIPTAMSGEYVIPYFDLKEATPQWRAQSRGGNDGWNPPSGGTGIGYYAWHFDPSRRLAWGMAGDNSKAQSLWGIDFNDFTGTTAPHGLQNMAYTGAWPIGANSSGASTNAQYWRWAYCPLDGRWYSFTGAQYVANATQTINQLFRLTPPDLKPGDKSGTWVFDSVTVICDGFTQLPWHAGTFGNDPNGSYITWCWVPSLGCFAWLPGTNDNVYLVSPP